MDTLLVNYLTRGTGRRNVGNPLGTPALKDELSKRFAYTHFTCVCMCVSKPVLVNLIHMGECLNVKVGQVSCLNLKSYCSIY